MDEGTLLAIVSISNSSNAPPWSGLKTGKKASGTSIEKKLGSGEVKSIFNSTRFRMYCFAGEFLIRSNSESDKATSTRYGRVRYVDW